MDADGVTGVYTYRSLLNRPDPVGDFNAIRFAEAEVHLLVRVDGTVGGTLAFPAPPGSPQQSFLDLSGRVLDWNPVRLQFTGRGRADTDVFDFVYDYEGEVAPAMPGAVDQRLTLTGSVVRSQDHGSGGQTATAGATASFVAVKRPFVEPRDVPGVGLIEPVRTMLARRLHRLHHTVWHTLRNTWWSQLDQQDRDAVAQLNWGIERPPFAQQGGLDLTGGAGEDFLFMHRRMIAMVREGYGQAGAPAPTGWATLPAADTPQFGYTPQPDPADPARRVFAYDPASSGSAVPPATPEFLSLFDPTQRPGNAFLKSPRFFGSVMRPHERIFRSPRYLASLSLGALGNLLEFTVHNQMHLRWASVPRDPVTGVVGGRGDFDLDEKWDDPRNDWLGDFYSSHVNPVFWRLHGWVDDRIEDWFRAHEAAHPGAVRPRAHKGVDWFERGDWVDTATPFDQPDWWDHGGHGGHGGSHGGDEEKQIEEMLAVLEVVRRAAERPGLRSADAAVARLTGPLVPGSELTSFAHWLDVEPEASE
jgi:hypothetical protein